MEGIVRAEWVCKKSLIGSVGWVGLAFMEDSELQLDHVTCRHLPECGMPYRGFKT
jgi:hypothetical protein